MNEIKDYLCVLELDGFNLNLYLISFNKEDKIFKISAYLDFFFNNSLSFQAVNVYFLSNDFLRLNKYLKTHIEKLESDRYASSPPFVSFELDIEIKAEAGDFRTIDDGEFTIQIMLQYKKSNDNESSVYIGAKGVTTFSKVNKFQKSINDLIAYSSTL